MEKIPYLRVGTAYFKSVHAPNIARHFNEILVHWNIEIIRWDHGKDYLARYRRMTALPVSRATSITGSSTKGSTTPLATEPMVGKIDISISLVRCRGKGKRALEKTSSRNQIT